MAQQTHAAKDLQISVSDSVHVAGYLKMRHIRANRDRSLPERGVTRSEGGERRGRDGRLVYREAVYDPYADLAREKVVDVETGKTIIDKVESMKAKYQRRGRWKPPQT